MSSLIPINNEIEKYQFLYHFIPHPKHKKRATLLSAKALFLYTVLVASLIGITKIVPLVAPGVLGYASDIYVTELLDETNNVRKKQGLPALKLNDRLSQAAYQKATDMFKDDYWAHISPTGTKPWDFIISSGYDYSFAGENLAKNFNSSKEVVIAWTNSKSHRENLLNDKYEDIGFAVVNGVLEGYETTLVVQMFGAPRSSAYVASASAKLSQPLKQQTQGVSDIVVKETNTSAESLSIDLSTASKFILSSFIGFLITLMLFDLWLSKRMGILKFTGHTVAHITFLIFVLAVVYITVSPGRIL